MAQKVKLGILMSGRGSNMSAIIDAAKSEAYPAEIAVVISNRPKAGGLKIAQDAGIRTEIIDHTSFDERESFERSLDKCLRNYGCELIVNAGFMRLLTPWFVSAWENKQLNIHPSLLPAFKGLNTHERALTAGVKLHGCTVHFVTEGMDDGPIVGQAAVPVFPNDDAGSLAARVLEAEHILYPECISRICRKAYSLRRGRVFLTSDLDQDLRHISNPKPTS